MLPTDRYNTFSFLHSYIEPVRQSVTEYLNSIIALLSLKEEKNLRNQRQKQIKKNKKSKRFENSKEKKVSKNIYKFLEISRKSTENIGKNHTYLTKISKE